MKLPLTPEQQEWIDSTPVDTPVEPNPCVRLYGIGPSETKCKTCSHLYCVRKSNRYYKCNLRKHTNGPGSDHRVGWNACAKYEPNEFVLP